jgi:small-conductance mechanosensitive channel
MEIWERWLLVAVLVVGAIVLAKIVDWRMSKRELPAAAATRYGVLRRSLMTAIIFVGVLSALLVVPEVRAIAAGLLASSAIVGLVIGLAAQRPLANFVAGIVIAFTQPLRLGDTITIDGMEGVVEEIGLTYTFIKTRSNERLVIPNEKLASDTILNSTIRSREKVAEISLQVPLGQDLGAVVDRLRTIAGDGEVFVSDLSDNPTVVVQVAADDRSSAERLERELRLRAYEALRAEGAYG